MTNYRYPANYPFIPQPPPPRQDQMQPQPDYGNAPYQQAPPQYDRMRLVHPYANVGQPPPPPPPPPPQGQPPPPPPPPPPQHYGGHATYTPQYFPGDRRDIRTMNTMRNFDFSPFPASGVPNLQQPHAPHGQPPPPPPPPQPQPPPPPQSVRTSEGYAVRQVVRSPPNAMMPPQASSSMAMFWQHAEPVPAPPPPTGPQPPPPPPPQGPPPTAQSNVPNPGRVQQQPPPPSGPPPSGPPSQRSFNESSFNEPNARITAAATFERFAQDNGDFLDLQEFMDAMRALHLAITYHDAIESFFRADNDRDGRVSKNEFVDVYIAELRNIAPFQMA